MTSSSIHRFHQSSIFPPPDALYFQNSCWIPEMNLVTINVDDIWNENEQFDTTHYATVQIHEIFHTQQGSTGAIYNRMAWIEEATANLVQKPDINEFLKHRIAIDRLHLETLPLLEAQTAISIDTQIDTLIHNDPVSSQRETLVEYLELNKKATLQKSKKVSQLYDMFRDLYERTKSYTFAITVGYYALDIPCIIPESQIRFQNPNYSPVIRFEASAEALKDLDRKKPLEKRENFSKFVGGVPIYSLDFFMLLNSYIGFVFGPLYIEDSKLNAFKLVQSPQKFFKEKSSQERIEEHEKFIRDNYGEFLLDIHRAKIGTNFIYVAYKGKDFFHLIPNYYYLETFVLHEWSSRYLLWLLMESVTNKTEKDTLLNLGKFFIQDVGRLKYFRQNIDKVFSEIDYSKVDSMIFEEFKETSKQLGRHLNWN